MTARLRKRIFDTAILAAGTLPDLRREIAGGLAAAFVTLPICMASGVIAYNPLGANYTAAGAGAGLFGAIYGGAAAALFATSSFVTSSARTSLGLIQASLAASLAGSMAFGADFAAFGAAIAVCVVCAGLWQIVFGLFGIARVIKFTPHPVLAGFLNGVALLIVGAQLKPFFTTHGGQLALPSLHDAVLLAFVLALTVLLTGCGKLVRRLPAPLIGLAIGSVLFYALKLMFPAADLGPTLGELSVGAPQFPLAEFANRPTAVKIFGEWPHLATVSLALAIVATFESLMTFRVAQDLTALQVHPTRDLIAQGIGNCIAGLTGGVGITASPSPTRATFNAGARTRLAAMTTAITLLALTLVFPRVLSAIPKAVFSALLIGTGIQLFDRWSLTLPLVLLRGEADRRRAHDLAIVLVVMGVTVTVSVVAGIAAGFVLACGAFVINMSRPIIRRRYVGLWSKRSRGGEHMAVLRTTASRRVVLELEGVLFFGNADDLSHTLADLFKQAEMVVLDFRGISDIDASGANILRNSYTRGRKSGRQLLFSNVSQTQLDTIRGVVGGGGTSGIFPDLDSALEWMEEQTLRAKAGGGAHSELMPLEQHDFTRDLDQAELNVLRSHLVEREFPPGTKLVSEGLPIDRMWLFVRGSASVRLRVDDARGSRRIASLASGTGTAHGILLRKGERALADVLADEPLTCYELTRSAYESVLREHPYLAAKLLVNVGLELRRRLRTTFDDFRQIAG